MESEGESKPSSKGKAPEEQARREVLWLRIAIVAVAAVGLIVGLVMAGGDDDDEEVEEAPAPASSRIVSPAELRSAAAVSPTPIYWAGEQPDTEIELTEEPDGSVYVRYLPEGAEVGSEADSSLTIGTYPQDDPEAELDAVAARPGAKILKGENGREVVSSKESPYSLYFASPDNTVQVEVYDPSARRAAELALSAEVEPAG
jgi:hypothetical protein